MLNEKQKVIQEKLEDVYRVTKVENIEGITNQVTGKTVTRHSFLNNLVTYMIGYCYRLIERYQLTTSEDFNVSYVLQALSDEEPEKLRDTEFLLEWAISKLALSFGLDPEDVKKVIE
ncbi:hypothetical protein [Mammaliicoccus sciuri]|uniref:hypothetical protein n=1 Tax=Mammaliicoccus sciuri TaxID=1296 RepID=UPI000E68961D|nr:hypothetical protein [Mammaliicoccus sciuri]RIO12553.1 hypothetical protein BUZ93_11540 [Mammaliicoccus sciuri]RIO18183.1 hypothetical protein BUZ92_09865 [Mammaliicoccus sciuri]